MKILIGYNQNLGNYIIQKHFFLLLEVFVRFYEHFGGVVGQRRLGRQTRVAAHSAGVVRGKAATGRGAGWYTLALTWESRARTGR